MQKLYDIVKSLAGEIEIYKEVMTEDENSTPDSYILLVSDVTDSGRFYGNGKAFIRNSDCDIKLISKGTAENSTSLHNINKAKITNLLESQDIPYIGVNLGYDDTAKTTQYVWSIGVLYGKEN